MVKDELAHKRIDDMEGVLRQHFKEHSRFEQALAENTKLTKTIAANTSELVSLVKGAKASRKFAAWIAPFTVLGGMIYGLWIWLSSWWPGNWWPK